MGNGQSAGILEPPPGNHPDQDDGLQTDAKPGEADHNRRPDASATMAHTIQELERLLDEAVTIAQMAGTVDDQKTAHDQMERPVSPTRRPSQAIAARVDKSLRKAPVVTTPSSDDHVRDESNSGEASSTARAALLTPQLAAEPFTEKKATLSRSRKGSTQTASFSRNQPAVFLEPPEIGPRTSSANSTSERRRTRPSPQQPPTLRLNSVELKDEEDEEKEHLLDESSRLQIPRPGHERHFTQMFGIESRQGSINLAHGMSSPGHKIDLNGVRHVDIANSADEVDVHQTCNHAPVARNWPNARKRWAALGSCVNTACLGFLIGIYSGEVPAIQYVIVDFDRMMIFGNVFLYCGLATPTLVFWPLPLLHGRKPYNIAALALTLCLQIPQGLAVSAFRTPDVRRYRILLLLSRGISGFVFGFANINNLGTLLDVFGASLKSSEANEGLDDPLDIRRHGGGMGVWLAIWSWCTVGSIALGFVIGAFIISGASVDWGFWVSLILLMFVLLLNIITPEVRRSAFRRTIAEVLGETGGFSRVARGEVKLHLTGNGPYWWGEEVVAGLRLSWQMVKQPGFLVLSVYAAWVYAQFTLVLMVSVANRKTNAD